MFAARSTKFSRSISPGAKLASNSARLHAVRSGRGINMVVLLAVGRGYRSPCNWTMDARRETPVAITHTGISAPIWRLTRFYFARRALLMGMLLDLTGPAHGPSGRRPRS